MVAALGAVRERAPLALCVPTLGLLSAATWALDGIAAGTAPFFMLMFAWVGLHFSAWAVAALALPAAAAYLTPLIAADRGPVAISGGAVFIPAMVVVGMLISRQVAHHRRSRAQVERMERWRAALSATLAHDVRSPLTTAQFAVETLAEDGPGLPKAQRDEIAGMAIRQINRIRRLASGLLDAERLDIHGGLRLDLEAVDLRKAVCEAIGYLSAPVAVEVPAGVRVRADPERLEQILVNLAANAIGHGALPVVVEAEAVGPDLVAIHVRDHGAGVPEDKRAVLFTRFSAADTNPSRSAWACGSRASWPAPTAATSPTPRRSRAAASPSPCPPRRWRAPRAPVPGNPRARPAALRGRGPSGDRLRGEGRGVIGPVRASALAGSVGASAVAGFVGASAVAGFVGASAVAGAAEGPCRSSHAA
nr:hypothetical protein GCM10020093_024010 [Planobispora longispora]